MAEKLTCPRPIKGRVCGAQIVNGVCPKCGCIVGAKKEQGDLPQPVGQQSTSSNAKVWGQSAIEDGKSKSRGGWGN